ncbi:hypothetical protein IC619_015420 [Hazenella sp. IB182353]|uniref:hypothetical protein n=1 Tax=Polycladospora coralii TaxID=2771432 RepID=UPI00174791CE|nr:hypothetical protein [Polycladospora coralii]MBS7531862.1 hypothetical protein [Polycladospora coralii]
MKRTVIFMFTLSLVFGLFVPVTQANAVSNGENVVLDRIHTQESTYIYKTQTVPQTKWFSKYYNGGYYGGTLWLDGCIDYDFSIWKCYYSGYLSRISK